MMSLDMSIKTYQIKIYLFELKITTVVVIKKNKAKKANYHKANNSHNKNPRAKHKFKNKSEKGKKFLQK